VSPVAFDLLWALPCSGLLSSQCGHLIKSFVDAVTKVIGTATLVR